MKNDSRIKVDKSSNLFDLSIKAKYDSKKQSMLFAWIVGWTLCGGYIINEYFKLEDEKLKTFFLVWIAFWIYFEYKVLYAFRWRKWGQERLFVGNNHLSIVRQFGKRGIPRHYDIDFIKNIRVLPATSNNFFQIMSNSYWNVSGEKIAFDCKGKTVVFGLELEEKTAFQLAKTLTKELNALKKES